MGHGLQEGATQRVGFGQDPGSARLGPQPAPFQHGGQLVGEGFEHEEFLGRDVGAGEGEHRAGSEFLRHRGIFRAGRHRPARRRLDVPAAVPVGPQQGDAIQAQGGAQMLDQEGEGVLLTGGGGQAGKRVRLGPGPGGIGGMLGGRHHEIGPTPATATKTSRATT